jgi:hypothetical protein
MALIDDPKLAVAVRDGQIRIAMAKIKAARVSDGNEAWQNSDINVDWLSARGAGSNWGYGSGLGGFGGFGGDGPGGFGGGWDPIGFSNGSSY